MKDKQRSSKYSLFFSVVFFIVLLVPVHKLDIMPSAIEKDFYGRTNLIQAATDFRVLLGDRVCNNVIVGKSNWLIYTGELSTDDYQNTIPISQKKLEEFQMNVDALKDSYAQQGITLLIVIAPNKNTIYSEYVPDELVVLDTKSRLDQLLDYMDQHGETKILDLRPALFQSKEEKLVYSRTDTHWNSYGAFIAYQEILSSLHADFPQLDAFPLTGFDEKELIGHQFDLSKVMNSSLFREDVVKLIAKNESNVLLRNVPIRGDVRSVIFSYNFEADLAPRAVVFHDSFFGSVNPFLREHFSQAVFVPHFTPVSDLNWVEEQKPDIVIIEFTERYIDDLLSMVNTK